MKYRGRTHPGIITYDLYLYFNSRSYRFASKSLEPFKKMTHTCCYLEMGSEVCASFQDRFRMKKNMIKKIFFVDETL